MASGDLPNNVSFFSKYPKLYRSWKRDTRTKLLQEYVRKQVLIPNKRKESIIRDVNNISKKCDLQINSDFFVNEIIEKSDFGNLGGQWVEFPILKFLSIIYRAKNIDPKNYLKLSAVWFAYEVGRLAFGDKSRQYTVFYKKIIHSLSNLSKGTVYIYEKILIDHGFLKIDNIVKSKEGFFYSELQIEILLPEVSSPTNIKEPDNIRSIYSEGINYQRNINFIKKHRDREPLLDGYAPLKSNRLICINGSKSKVSFQIELICFHVLLYSVWTDKSLNDLKFFNIPYFKDNPIKKKAEEWIDKNLPYYPNHKFNKKKYHLLQDEIKPILKEIRKIGIKLDIEQAEDELSELRDGFYETYGIWPEHSPKTEGKQESDRKIVEIIGSDIQAAKISSDFRIHCFFSHSSKTNRISTRQYPLQNTPKVIRHLFKPREGYIFLSCDIAAQDLVIAFFLAKDEEGLQVFIDNNDIYSTIESELYLTDRDQAKLVVLAFLHGANSTRTDSDLVSYLGSKKKAQDFINYMWYVFPKLFHYREKCVEIVRKTNFTDPTPLGFSRYLPTTYFLGDRERSIKFSPQARGTSIQATSAEFLKLIIKYLYEELPKDYYLVLPIHDELLFEVPEGKHNQIDRIFSTAKIKAKTVLFPDISGVVNHKIKWGYDWAFNQPTNSEKKYRPEIEILTDLTPS